jgi:hypothetical protein
MSEDCDAPGANIMKQQWPAKYRNQMQQALLDSRDWIVFLERPCIFESVVDSIFLKNVQRNSFSRDSQSFRTQHCVARQKLTCVSEVLTVSIRQCVSRA